MKNRPKGRSVKTQTGASRQQSPRLLEFFDHMPGREVEVDHGRLKRVMPQQAL